MITLTSILLFFKSLCPCTKQNINITSKCSNCLISFNKNSQSQNTTTV